MHFYSVIRVKRRIHRPEVEISLWPAYFSMINIIEKGEKILYLYSINKGEQKTYLICHNPWTQGVADTVRLATPTKVPHPATPTKVPLPCTPTFPLPCTHIKVPLPATPTGFVSQPHPQGSSPSHTQQGYRSSHTHQGHLIHMMKQTIHILGNLMKCSENFHEIYHSIVRKTNNL